MITLITDASHLNGQTGIGYWHSGMQEPEGLRYSGSLVVTNSVEAELVAILHGLKELKTNLNPLPRSSVLIVSDSLASLELLAFRIPEIQLSTCAGGGDVIPRAHRLNSLIVGETCAAISALGVREVIVSHVRGHNGSYDMFTSLHSRCDRKARSWGKVHVNQKRSNNYESYNRSRGKRYANNNFNNS
jgi:ribonuclease HI